MWMEWQSEMETSHDIKYELRIAEQNYQTSLLCKIIQSWKKYLQDKHAREEMKSMYSMYVCMFRDICVRMWNNIHDYVDVRILLTVRMFGSGNNNFSIMYIHTIHVCGGLVG